MTAQSKNLGRIRPNPCGEYDSTRPYALMDIVSIGGESWMAKGDVPAGNSPAGIVDNDNWQHVLSRGEPDTYPVTAGQTEDTRVLREWAAQILATQQQAAGNSEAITNLDDMTVKKDSDTGAVVIPSGTISQRPNGTDKYLRYNTETGTFEGFDGVAWGSVGGGATGGGGNAVFVENDQIVTDNYTIPSDKNASSTGPITIADGVTVTVSDGARWVIL